MEKDSDNRLLESVAANLDLSVAGIAFHAAVRILAGRINDMLLTDFERLVQLLYRLDISENKLRNVLKENQDRDAGLLIAELMIEREREKIRSRNEFRQTDDISDEERW